MNIYQVIESCWLDKEALTDDLRFDVNQLYDSQKWIDLSLLFLNGIGSKHNVPGKVVDTFYGINDFYKENGFITPKQSMYLSNNVINYWDQLSFNARNQLYL